MSRRGVLSGWYPAAAAMVIFALVPALALSGALLLASPMLAHLLQMSSESRGLASGMAAAAAPDPGMFIAGHVLQGLCTSLLLIAAMPSLALTTATPSL